MALSEAPRYGKELQYGFAVEATYGTGVTDASAVALLNGLDSVSIDRNIRFYENKTGQAKDPLLGETIGNTSGSAAIITVNGNLNKDLLPFFLLRHFQNVSTATYSYFDTHPVSPDSLTFICGDLNQTSRGEVYAGCVIQSLNFSAERGDDDRIKFEMVLHAKNAGLYDQTIDPTNWQVSGSKPDNYGALHLTDMTYQIDVGGGYQDVSLSSWALNFAYDEVNQLTPDGAGGYSEVGLVGRDNNTFELTVLDDTNVQIAKANMREGSLFKFKSVGNFDAIVTGQVTTHDMDIDGLLKIPITCAMKAENASTNMAEITAS